MQRSAGPNPNPMPHFVVLELYTTCHADIDTEFSSDITMDNIDAIKGMFHETYLVQMVLTWKKLKVQNVSRYAGRLEQTCSVHKSC